MPDVHVPLRGQAERRLPQGGRGAAQGLPAPAPVPRQGRDRVPQEAARVPVLAGRTQGGLRGRQDQEECAPLDREHSG